MAFDACLSVSSGRSARRPAISATPTEDASKAIAPRPANQNLPDNGDAIALIGASSSAVNPAPFARA